MKNHKILKYYVIYFDQKAINNIIYLIIKYIMENTETKLYKIAESQSGYFTAKQAISAGYLATNHNYHVRQGHWIREFRSIYRLAHFPSTPEGEYTLWALWSRNREEISRGVYSHETALSLYEVSDAMPSKLHMTVPSGFRRSAQTPPILILHYRDLPPANIKQQGAYALTTPFRTMQDLTEDPSISEEILGQSLCEFRDRGLLTERQCVQLAEKYPRLVKHVVSLEKMKKKSNKVIHDPH